MLKRTHPLGSDKKIAIFIPSLDGGGAEHVMVMLANGIALQGYPVDLVAAKAEGHFKTEVSSKVNLVDLNSKRVITSTPALVRYLRIEKPRALLSVLHCNIVALISRKLSGMHTRVFISERSTLSSMSRGARDVRVSLMPYLARFFYPWADGIIAVSKGVADDLAHTIRIPENLIRVIYNPVITPELKRKVLEPISHPWFMPGQPPVILAVGRLSKAKDYPTLLKAFKKVRQSVNARLLILGEGEERPALNLLIQQLGIEEDVSLPGFVPNPYPFMAHAALFVLSSVREGLPGSLIEALFCGVPVVSTDCKSGPAEILDHGRYGKLVPVGDVDVLAQEIMITLEQKTRYVPEEAIQPYEFESAVNLYINALMGN